VGAAGAATVDAPGPYIDLPVAWTTPGLRAIPVSMAMAEAHAGEAVACEMPTAIATATAIKKVAAPPIFRAARPPGFRAGQPPIFRAGRPPGFRAAQLRAGHRQRGARCWPPGRCAMAASLEISPAP
jgi:hypothetical protein